MRNILIVDDDKNNRLAIKLNIHKHTDLKIYEAENGLEALELTKQLSIHLIFIDIMMPVMDGIEATKEIKKVSPKTMIVAISAMDDDTHKSLMLQAGCEDYITKPFNPDILKKRLSNYLHLIVNRSTNHANTKPRNCYNEKVYDKTIMFTISHESSLALIWEEYLFSEKYSGLILLSDAIRTLYNISLLLLEEGTAFIIFCEENEQALYFTIKYTKSLENRDDLHAIISREFSNGESMIRDDCFSIKIPCVTQATVSHSSKHETQTNSDSQEKSKNIVITHDVVHADLPSRLLVRTEKQKISALEYIMEHEEEFMDKCEEFEKLYETLDHLLFEINKTHNYNLLNNFGRDIIVFSKHVDTLFEFHNLSDSLYGLGNILVDLDINCVDEELKKLLVGFCGSFLSDLDSWIRDIFVEKTAVDIHYLDSSLSSSFVSIVSILCGKNENDKQSEIELF